MTKEFDYAIAIPEQLRAIAIELRGLAIALNNADIRLLANDVEVTKLTFESYQIELERD